MVCRLLDYQLLVIRALLLSTTKDEGRHLRGPDYYVVLASKGQFAVRGSRRWVVGANSLTSLSSPLSPGGRGEQQVNSFSYQGVSVYV